MKHKYSDEEFIRKAHQYNEETTLDMVPKWSSNIADNIEICRRANDITKFPTTWPVKTAILVGAGWSLTDDDIKALKGCENDVDIIVCNKSYKRLLDNGVRPQFVVLLDADAISKRQFAFLDEQEPAGIEAPFFFVSSCVYPPTLRTIARCLAKAMENYLYIFNPDTDLEGQIPIHKIWEWMNFKPTMRHGGSVGGVMSELAMLLNYDRIAFLGFDFCERPDPKWSMGDAIEREHMYYPDIDQFVSVPFNFMCYSTYILNRMKEYGMMPGKEVINLSNSPIMRHTPVLKQREVHEFVQSILKKI